jgi:hypothetical protein
VFGGSKEPLVLVIEPDAAVHGGEVEHPTLGPLAEKNGEACRLLSGNRITARSSERMTSPAPFRVMALSSLSCWASVTNHCRKNRRVSSVYSSQIFTNSSRAYSFKSVFFPHRSQITANRHKRLITHQFRAIPTRSGCSD